MSSRVERMFGPRESWGQGDEMAAVRERAVRQEGGGPEKGRKGNPSVGKADSSPKRGAKKAGGGPVVGEKKAPSVSKADSLCGDPVAALTVPRTVIHSRDCASLTPMLAHRGARGNRGGGAWGGLAGFVSIRCGCGRVVNTCLHQRTPVFKCKDCGGETDLAHVSNIHMKCARCGFTGKYRTNRTEEKIQMECLNCSDIVYLTKVRRGNYVVEGEA